MSLRRHPDFVKLWVGESISHIGSQVTLLAVPFIAITVLHASTFEVALLTAVEMSPFLLVGLPAGAIVDRLRRRPVMVVGDVGRALALVSIPVAEHFGALTLAQLYVVVLITGSLTVFFDVAYQSYLPSLLKRDDLVGGNARLETSRSVAQIAGPALAGGLIGLVGPATAVWVDSASFAVSAVAIAAIRRREPRPERAVERPRLRADIAEGLRYVLGHRLLRSLAGCTATNNLFGNVTWAVVLVYAVRELGLDAGQVGIAFAVGSCGFVAGIAALPRLTARFGLGQTIVWSAFATGLGGWLFPLATPGTAMVMIGAAMALSSMTIPVYNINQLSLRQAITPARIQGRMNATMRFMVWGTLPLGAVLGGVLGSTIGLRPTLVVAAAGQMLSFLWVLFSPVPGVRELPAGDDDGSAGEEGDGAVPGVGGIVGPMAGPIGRVDEPVLGLGVDDHLDLR